jgi:hypothetical protein
VLLDGLLNRSQEVNLANMRKMSRLTLGVMKSLYPQADLGATSEGFIATCTKDEVNKLMEDSVVTASQVVEMFPIDMS